MRKGGGGGGAHSMGGGNPAAGGGFANGGIMSGPSSTVPSRGNAVAMSNTTTIQATKKGSLQTTPQLTK